MKHSISILAAAGAFVLALPANAQSQAEPDRGRTLLEIVATGEHYVAPDEATLNAGVVTFAPTSRQAAADNATAMDQVVAALRAAGLTARDIQTSNLSLEPRYADNRRDSEPPAIVGYQARNTVTVRVRDVQKASDYLTTLFEAGANTVSGPNFSLNDSTAAMRAARADAVAEAKVEAEAYAAAFDMRIVQVRRVSERGQRAQYNPIVVTGSRMGSVPPPPPPPPPSVSAPVAVGEMRQEVTLWVDYILEPR